MSRTIRDISYFAKNHDMCDYRDDRVSKFFLNGSLPHWERNFSHRRLRREGVVEVKRFFTNPGHEVILTRKPFDRTGYW